jgi:histidinol-phosphate aminotransferase
MADSGVVIRYRGTELHCSECLRVTIGTEEENISFINLLVQIWEIINRG